MAWDPAATNVLTLVGVLIAFVVVIYFVKRAGPEDPPLELAYPDADWGQALHSGEQIEVQVPVLQPAAWWLRRNTDPTRNGRPSGRQLALTTSTALLVAQRGLGRLWDRQRYDLSAIRVVDLKGEGEHHLSLRLVVPRGKMKLYRVPRRFVDRLRAVGVRVEGVG